jgi:MYXO-CTERM domain-containing protein
MNTQPQTPVTKFAPAIVALAGLLTTPLTASTLNVNLGPAGSTAEPGFTLLASANSTGTPAVSLPLGTVGGVSVVVTTGGGANNRFRSVNRGVSAPYSGAFDGLTESWIGTEQGTGTADPPSALTIILNGVDPGPHLWTSYHFDNGTGVSGNGNQSGRMTIEYSVDSGASFTVAATDFQIQDNEGIATVAILPFTTTFTAVAGQTVQFRFTNTALGLNAASAVDPAQDFTVVNGFSVTPVPEPSALWAGLLCLGGIALRRRR